MGLLSWVGRVLKLTDGQFWSAYCGGETWAGRPVNEENSLQLSAWWRCVRLYADVVGSLPLKFYERTDNDDRVQNREHVVANLIGFDPNLDQTAQEFWSGMAASLAMLGNAYAEKRYIGKSLAALDPLPCYTRPDRTRNKPGDLEYYYYDRGKEERLPAGKVLHIRGFAIGKSDMGLSPLAAGRQGLSIALATEESAGKTFSQGMRNSGFFTGPKMLPEQRAQFTKTFIDPIIGNDASAHYGILENGFAFQPINIPPKDAEMLLSRRFNVEEICRFMGVPPILVGHSADGQTMWGTGVEAIINQWLTAGLNSFLTNIEKSINKRLLIPQERPRFYAEFERNALLRIDSAARAEFISKMIQNAQMTPNEGRKTDNRLPMPGGDVLLVNSTLVPLTDAGRPPVGVIKSDCIPFVRFDPDQPRDDHGRFGSGGGFSGTVTNLMAAASWLSTASASEVISSVAHSHLVKEALIFGINSVLAHGSQMHGSFLDSHVEEMVSHAVHNFSDHASIASGQARDLMKSAVTKLASLRKTQLAAKATESMDGKDPVLELLNAMLRALDKMEQADKGRR